MRDLERRLASIEKLLTSPRTMEELANSIVPYPNESGCSHLLRTLTAGVTLEWLIIESWKPEYRTTSL